MKDDSARDKAIDRLVAGKLRTRLQEESRDCPDAETLAAYVERTLSAGERQTWETHLVTCRFCQDQVAVLVRMSEGDELTEAESHPAGAPALRKVAGFRWVWAALVALIMAGLWYKGEFRSLIRQQQPTTAEAPAPSPTSLPADKDTAPTAPAGPRRELAEAEPSSQEAAKPPSERKPSPRISVYGSPGSSVVVAPGEGGGVGYGVGREADAAAIRQPADERGAVESTAATGGLDDLNRTASERYRADVGGKPSAPAASAEAPLTVVGQTADGEAGDEALSKEVARADALAKGAPRQAGAAQRRAAPSDSVVELHGFIEDRRTWRVGRDGLIQKAAPDGTWETRPSGVKANLFGISFATPAVGWAVGQSGTVLRTTDGGATWTRMPSPTSEDLVRVGAISAAKVNVITRSGQTLQSADGGRTWKPLRQE